MASRPGTVDFIVEQAAGTVQPRKMFGEYALFSTGAGTGKLVALVCDDGLYVKPTAAGRAHAGEVEEASPYPGAKPCLLIPGDRWEDGGWLTELFRLTAAELPVPVRKPRGKRRAGG